MRDVRVAIGSERRVILIMYKEVHFLSEDVTSSLPKVLLVVLF